MFVQPEHTKATHIGRAPHACKHILGRQGNAHHHQLFTLAMEQGGQLVPQLELARMGKALGHQHLQGTAAVTRHHAPAAQEHAVDVGWRLWVQANQAPHHGVRHMRQVNLHRLRVGHMDLRHTGHSGELCEQAAWRTLDVGEHIGKVRLGVIHLTRPRQSVVRTEAGDEARHPTGHHQGDGEHLAPHGPQVAQQFAV